MGQLQAKEEAELDDTVYDLTFSVDSIFNKIQDLQDVCSLLSKDKTDTQLVDIAYLILKKSSILWTLYFAGIRNQMQIRPSQT